MIVIPMAGNGSRFANSGYSVPKFALPLLGMSLFDWAVLSFRQYFESERFVFVTRSDQGGACYAKERLDRLGVNNYRIVELPGLTSGQAETVCIGALESGFPLSESLTIFNIDTIRPGYRFPKEAIDADGFIDVVNLPGDHWSFAKVSDDGLTVVSVSEKVRISDLCSTGLYWFKSADKFIEIYQKETTVSPETSVWKGGERYIAPLYNRIIEKGGVVVAPEIERKKVLFSGTPDEYEALRANAVALKFLSESVCQKVF